MARILAVTAVVAERDAVVRGAGINAVERIGPYDAVAGTTAGGDSLVVVAGGVGPAASAAAAMAGALDGADLLLSLGIGGAYHAAQLRPGDVVVATRIIAADLGAMSESRFLDIRTLGFGVAEHECEPELIERARDALDAATLPVVVGPVLTLSTATGTDERADELMSRHGAIAEAMEGAGVAHVAALVGVPVLEMRTISNAIGRRDTSTWDIPLAIDALEGAARALLDAVWDR
jgi:futalosine hydrolase